MFQMDIGKDLNQLQDGGLVIRNTVLNIVTSVVLWTICKMRNSICFQGKTWSRIHEMKIMVVKMLRRWPFICREENAGRLNMAIETWEKVAGIK